MNEYFNSYDTYIPAFTFNIYTPCDFLLCYTLCLILPSKQKNILLQTEKSSCLCLNCF